MYSSGNVYNTTINIKGHCGYPGGYMCGRPMMGSCLIPPPPLFPYPMSPAAACGFTAGTALAPLIPGIFKGIGNAFCSVGKFMWNSVLKPVGSFMWNSVIKPVGSFMWNSVMKPVGKFMWNDVIKPVGKFFGKIGSAIGKGVSNLWKSIFGKK